MTDEMNKEKELFNMRERYRVYINNHITNVQTAWSNIKTNPVCREALKECLKIWSNNQEETTVNISVKMANLLNTITNLVNVHDASKTSDDEFEPYRKNFFPVDEAEKEANVQDFEKAWEHHYRNNMHHWDSWALDGTKEQMGLPFVIEMCCDWIAMSINFPKRNAYEWYMIQEDIVLGTRQKKIVEYFLQIYYSQFNTDGTKKM